MGVTVLWWQLRGHGAPVEYGSYTLKFVSKHKRLRHAWCMYEGITAVIE